MRRVAALSMCLLTTLSMIPLASAKEVTTDLLLETYNSGGGGAEIIQVTVPSELIISMDEHGDIVVPTDANIINNTPDKSVQVVSIDTNLEGGWQAVDFQTDLSNEPIGTKKLALEFRGISMDERGSFPIEASDWTIPSNDSLPLNMDAKLPLQEPDQKVKLAAVSFTISQATTPDQEPEPSPSPDPGPEVTDFIVTAENKVLIGYTGEENEDLIIPSEFTGEDGINYRVVEIGMNAFNKCQNLRSVVVPDTVKVIGNGAFYTCENLTSIKLPEGLEEISHWAFAYDTKLVDINIPSTVKTIGNTVFVGNMFTSIEIPNGIESIGTNAFASCHELKEVTIPGSITTLGNSAFYNCGKLERVTILSPLKELTSAMFAECTSLVEVNLPNTLEVIRPRAFEKCAKLTSIDLPDSLITLGDSVFNQCTGLTDIVIPDNVTRIESSTFYECGKLSNVVLPNNLAFIGTLAFSNCTNLPDIVIPSSVTRIDQNAFSNVPHITYNGTATGSPWGALSIN